MKGKVVHGRADEQIITVLREQEAGAKAGELARKHGIYETTLYNWKTAPMRELDFLSGITNANSAYDLSGLAGALNAAVGLGVNVGAQIAKSNNGIWTASVTPPISSIGEGMRASIYQTNAKIRTNISLLSR